MATGARLGLLAVVCCLIAGPVSPQGEGRLAELRGIRRQIEELQGALDRLDVRAQDLEGELERTELELRLQTSRVEEAVAALALAVEELESSEQRIDELDEAIAGQRDRLRRRLVALYQMGGQGYLRLLLAVEGQSEPLEVIRQMRFLVRRDVAAIEDYFDLLGELEAEMEVRERRRTEAESWVVSERERRGELVEIQARQGRLLEALEDERQTLSRQAEELADKELRLSRLINYLYSESAGVMAGTPIQEFRGVLDWPIRGRVLTGFGPREDPRYGTLVPHNGIEIATPSGEQVQVVFPGKVLFAAPFEGFGFTAVVQHPERVFTLYAGLESLSVSEGDVLSLGAGVGSAGESLYFEVRVESRPQDPLRWLR